MNSLRQYTIPSRYSSGDEREKRKRFEDYYASLSKAEKVTFVDYIVATYRPSEYEEDLGLWKEGVRSEKELALLFLGAIPSPRSEAVVNALHIGLPSRQFFSGLDMDVMEYAIEKGLKGYHLLESLDDVFSGVDKVAFAKYLLSTSGRESLASLVPYMHIDKGFVENYVHSLPPALAEEFRSKLEPLAEEEARKMWSSLLKLIG
jgi:hypothetical protein